jgi:tetratricopeptide (TPR) repeat protein
MSDEERLNNNDDANEPAGEEEGSDELLADDALRLPESANIRVRLHAVRAWLARRRREAAIAVGEAALALQAATQPPQEEQRPRRRHIPEETSSYAQIARAQERLRASQEALRAFDEAQEKLDECIDHANGERVLVEYYLLLEQTLLDAGYLPNQDITGTHDPWYDAMVEVLRRIEHAGTPEEP